MSPPRLVDEIRISIARDVDVFAAREEGRRLAMRLGFSSGDATMLATAISELARNVVLYARHGELLLTPELEGEPRGLVITARDNGPGLPRPDLALRRGYSTSGRSGLGLSMVRQLMDEIEIVTEVGKGTTIIARKWLAPSQSPRSSSRR
jgi:serine/threonine-protein kinase RsbT